MKRFIKASIVLIAAVLLSPGRGLADPIVVFTINPPVQTGVQGGTLTFNATLTITGVPAPVFINGNAISTSPGFGFAGITTPSSSLLMLDDLAFFLNAPLMMSSDGTNGPSSATFNLFTVAIGANVIPGAYLGTFSIVGGLDPSAQNILAASDFRIDVMPANPAPVPAPGTLVLVATGLAVACISRRLRPGKITDGRQDSGDR
jgi:hypothetical protein